MTEKKRKSFGALSDFFSEKLESFALFTEVLEGVGVDLQNGRGQVGGSGRTCWGQASALGQGAALRAGDKNHGNLKR